jgi:NDP-sugar pyrophosphorylase family protein
MPFLNRPFIYHIVETLLDLGIREFEFCCHSDASAYRKVLGDGERWGAKFRFETESSLHSETEGFEDCQVFSANAIPFSSESPTRMLRIDSPNSYLSSQQNAMSRNLSSMLTVERQLRDDIWVGRNVSIHPSALLNGPILIGENTRIASGVTLGPYAVIGSNCLVDRNTSIERATVLPNIYLGEGLQVTDSIVFPETIVNARLGVGLPIKDSLIIGSFPW